MSPQLPQVQAAPRGATARGAAAVGELSGLVLEYRIVQLYSRDPGQREATLTFDVGQGTQDLGYRNEVPTVPLANSAFGKSYWPVTFHTVWFSLLLGALNRTPAANVAFRSRSRVVEA